MPNNEQFVGVYKHLYNKETEELIVLLNDGTMHRFASVEFEKYYEYKKTNYSNDFFFTTIFLGGSGRQTIIDPIEIKEILGKMS